MELLVTIIVLTVVLVIVMGLWLDAKKKVNGVVEVNNQLEKQVQKSDDLLKQKNYRIKQLFLAQVDKADRTELVTIFHRLLEDKGGLPPRRLSDGSKSPSAK